MPGFRVWAVGLVAALALSQAAPGQEGDVPAKDAPPPIDYNALSREIYDAYAGRCDGAYDVLLGVSQQPDFTALLSEERATILSAVFGCQLAAADVDAAYATAGEIWRIAPEGGWALRWRLTAATEVSDPKSAATDLLEAIQTRPDLIAALTMESVERLMVALERSEAADIELEVLTALETLDWTPTDTVMPQPQSFDVRRALLLAEAGDLDAARARLSGLTKPGSMIEVLIDRRYEPLWEDFVALHGMDAHAAAEIEVADTAALMEAHPDHLEPIVAHMLALLTAGRPEEAVEIGQRLRAELASGEAQRYSDVDEEANWVLNALGYALEAAGDRRQARVVLRAAASQNEDGVTGNVSQAINSALGLVREGRGAEALRALDRVDISRVADYGQMFLLEVRACAAAQAGQTADADAVIGEMLARWNDNAYATLQALLCAERIDEAAALMVRQLETVSERAGALLRLQVFDPPPFETDYALMLRGRFDEVRNHPDVRAAAERYGRILTWNVPE
jgi:tetratricopeptide (TPR) repeat protein